MQSSDEVQSLLVDFWEHKNEADRRQKEEGKKDAGAQARNARHMKKLGTFVRQMFVNAGLSEADVMVNGVIPGYFRRSKNWDVVATYKGQLVALVELKSQVGSNDSNGNNRIEEALGNPKDAATAQELNQVFGKLPIWTAFGVVFGSSPENAKAVGLPSNPLFPLDPVFNGMTYGRQWEIAIERFIQTGSYSAGWMVTSWVSAEGQVKYVEPVATATAQTLETQIQARVAFAKQVLG
ncbi:hypothetical protein A20C1_03518 [marine actinobacterium PHSC20C1]|nr:hypothetical protein A20C1_03518 [marine actinobacterium PHSC20C1]